MPPTFTNRDGGLARVLVVAKTAPSRAHAPAIPLVRRAPRIAVRDGITARARRRSKVQAQAGRESVSATPLAVQSVDRRCVKGGEHCSGIAASSGSDSARFVVGWSGSAVRRLKCPALSRTLAAHLRLKFCANTFDRLRRGDRWAKARQKLAVLGVNLRGSGPKNRRLLSPLSNNCLVHVYLAVCR